MKTKYYKKHPKFDAPTVYINGIYYFPKDIAPSTKREGRPFETQVCYYDGKWRQDTAYLTPDQHTAIISTVNLQNPGK